MTTRLSRARWLALLLPAALLAGAWGFQLIGGLYPCEMCHWQRWPHYAAVAVALLAFFAPPRPARALVLLAALLIAASGVIGALHAGVEYHWWQGFTGCTSTVSMTGMTAAERLDAIMHAPMVRCDAAQWTLGGVSLAGFNAIVSLLGAALVAWLGVKAR
ncbi:Disulfide bond formation protein DsbB [Sphingomonas gellani]|uniref:Disulfide bond formation protein DsbB n=1 Tax=Sphingomonas gellani TaxID=1166340 RepID=A0A1H8IU20_9SPHN|nr:disulfide bond formation protein B [Sphingomonas gellani]SEN72270.1 Disulfide bond formation protein DsbB [Sphingomonas gellani]